MTKSARKWLSAWSFITSRDSNSSWFSSKLIELLSFDWFVTWSVTWYCHMTRKWLGWILRDFKIFIFIPKLSFSDFNEFALYMIFHVNSHHQKISDIHIQGDFVKIREFTLVIIFMTYPSKMKILKFLGIQPTNDAEMTHHCRSRKAIDVEVTWPCSTGSSTYSRLFLLRSNRRYRPCTARGNLTGSPPN